MSWVEAYKAWLKQWYSEDEDEISEIVEQAQKVVNRIAKVLPGIEAVLNRMTRDDMIMFDGFWRVCDEWLRSKGEVMKDEVSD